MRATAPLWIALFGFAFASPVALAGGVDRTWVGPSGGLFGDPKNWIPGGVPFGLDTAFFDQTDPATVAFFADRLHERVVMRRGNVVFELDGHAYELGATAGGGAIVGEQSGETAALTLLDGELIVVRGLIATSVSSTGTLSISTGATFSCADALDVGSGGTGELHVNSGGTAQTGEARVGVFAGSTGTATVFGSGSMWTVDGALEVGAGAGATGALSVLSSGHLVATTLSIGTAPNASGTVTIGVGAALAVQGPITVGETGDGSLTISGSSTVTSAGISSIGLANGSNGSVTISGSTSSWTNGPSGPILVGAGGPGTLTLEGGATVAAAPGVQVFELGTLRGNGFVEGDVTVMNGGGVSPGVSAGVLTVSGDYVSGHGGILEIELGGTIAGENHDALAVAGALELSGDLDELRMVLIDGFAPQLDDTFEIISAASVSETFDVVDLPPLVSGLRWRIVYTDGGVKLSVIEDCVFEDFEDAVVGAFPGGIWLDVGPIDPSPPNPPDPSAVVSATTDVYGGATNALEFVDAIAPSQGVYAAIPAATTLAAEASVRIDRYSDQASGPVTDWPFALAFAEFVPGQDIAIAPQLVVYVSTLTETWHLYGSDLETFTFDVDFEVPAIVGRWYSARLELDTISGSVDTIVHDLTSGTLVLADERIVPDWTPNAVEPDVVTIYDGELSEGVTLANLAVVDDICVDPLPAPTPGDANGDGLVNVEDLILVISSWGPCVECDDCPADLDGDCAVSVSDLVEVLLGWT